MGWIGKNLLLFVTLVLLVCVALFGLLIIAMSLYIGIMLSTYVSSSYFVHAVPGTLGGIIAVAVVIAFLVLAKMKKTKNKIVLLVFAVLLALLAFGQFVSGLSFIAYDYEGEDGVVYKGVKYEDNVAMYEARFYEEFKAKFSDKKKYGSADMNNLPPEPTIDALQKDFKCCGVHNKTFYENELMTMPKSCCEIYDVNVDDRKCVLTYKKGCVREFYEWLSNELIKFGVLLFIASLFTMVATVLMVVLIITGKKITVPE